MQNHSRYKRTQIKHKGRFLRAYKTEFWFSIIIQIDKYWKKAIFPATCKYNSFALNEELYTSQNSFRSNFVMSVE